MVCLPTHGPRANPSPDCPSTTGMLLQSTGRRNRRVNVDLSRTAKPERLRKKVPGTFRERLEPQPTEG